jgi:putative aldouronate transport system substrate-binding protein
VDFTADGTSGAFDTRVNLAFVSGDLPDILSSVPYRLYKEGVEAGLFADLTDIWMQYGSDNLKRIRNQYTSSFDYMMIDGRFYGLSGLSANEQFGNLLWIRDDWLANLNMQPPKTIDEMVAMARAFTNNDPDRNGMKDTYGLGLHNRLVQNNYSTLDGLFNSFGVPAWAHDGYYRDSSTGKVNFSYLHPNTKEALRLVQSMYKEGLIDPEFNTKDANKILDEVEAGRIGMGYGLQWGTWMPWNGPFKIDGTLSTPYAVPQKPGTTPVVAFNSNQSGSFQIMNSRHANPEAYIRMLNFYNSYYNENTPDEIYNKYIIDEQYRFSPATINEPQEVVYYPTFKTAYEKNGSTDGLPVNLINRFQQIWRFENGERTTADGQPDTNAYGLWGQYHKGGSMAVIMDQYMPNGWMYESILGGEWPSTLVTYSSTLQTITEVAFTEIIMGANVDTRYDQYVREWLRAGGQQVLDEMQTLYVNKK